MDVKKDEGHHIFTIGQCPCLLAVVFPSYLLPALSVFILTALSSISHI